MQESDLGMEECIKTITVQQLVTGKGRLIEVPYTASVSDTLNAMLAHNILAVPVAAPPGQWIGAGGSMILESDKSTGMVRKQYIGIVSVLDILIHLAELDDQSNTESHLEMVVSTVIGHSVENLSLWTISPGCSLYEALDPMCKGIHRALVPTESHTENIVGLELAESSPGYHMLTQMDIIRFLQAHLGKGETIFSSSIESLGAVQHSIFAVPASSIVTDTVRCMGNASLFAVAIVEPSPDMEASPTLAIGRGRKLIGTFSASDLRGCSAEALRSWSSLSVLEFVKKTYLARKHGFGAVLNSVVYDVEAVSIPLITCMLSSSLGEVMSKAVDNDVHRLWVTDEAGYLLGVVSLSDMLRVVRSFVKSKEEPAPSVIE
eukprot:c23821_g1_i1 orf=388-1515(+)